MTLCHAERLIVGLVSVCLIPNDLGTSFVTCGCGCCVDCTVVSCLTLLCCDDELQPCLLQLGLSDGAAPAYLNETGFGHQMVIGCEWLSSQVVMLRQRSPAAVAAVPGDLQCIWLRSTGPGRHGP